MSPNKKTRAMKAQMSEAETLWYEGKWIDRVPQWVSVIILGLVMLGIWYLVAGIVVTGPSGRQYSRLTGISKLLLPGPVETFEELWSTTKDIFTGGHILASLWITTREVLLGFLAAAAAGFTLGVVVGETRLGKRAVMPYLVALNALPKVAFAPVFVAWFGFGVNSKIVMALFVAFFPVIVDTAAGLYAVDADTLMLFQSLESSRWQTLRKLKLPSALPFIFAGLKSAAVFAVVGAVVGEYLGGGKGLGEQIRLSAQNLRLDRVFALIFYLGVLGILLFSVVSWSERKTLFWHKSEIVEIKGAGG